MGPIAPAHIRSIAVDQKLDQNQDQVLTREEIGAKLEKASRDIRNARSDIRFAQSRLRMSYGRGGYYGRFDSRGHRGVYRHRHIDSFAHSDLEFAASRLNRASADYQALSNAYNYLVATGQNAVSLVSEDFVARFGALPADQRAALLEADKRGNNDGSLTRSEYDEYNKKPFPAFLRKKRFQGKFGDGAHRRVVDALSQPAATTGGFTLRQQ